MSKDLVLASASPRRRRLLQSIGLQFRVIPAGIKEPERQGEDPAEYAQQLAWLKASDVCRRPEAAGAVVIGADTLVVIDGEVLGKPASEEDAYQKLTRLSGRSHEVITGVAVVEPASGKKELFFEQTEVTFRQLSPAEIRGYIATGEPMDKAGAYGIQGIGAVNVVSIRGDYFNVVGLPLARLYEVLSRFGIKVF